MNKYPIRHTMDFGEIKRYYFDKTFDESALCNNKCCPYYDIRMEQNCCYNDPETCDCGETHSLTVTFELTKDCEECGGTGGHVVGFKSPKDIDRSDPTILCPHCSDNGLPHGKVHRYWTPEEAAKEIKDKTGIDWEPTAVWCKRLNMKVSGFLGFEPDGYEWGLSTWKDKGNNYTQILIAFPGQPAPAEDWRP